MPSSPAAPLRGFGVATVAEWLTAANAEKGRTRKDGTPLVVKPRDVTDWLHRYGPDRPAERLAVTPAYPAPDVEIEVEGGRVIKGWTLKKRAPWVTWYDNRPGRGAGGGRPRKTAGRGRKYR